MRGMKIKETKDSKQKMKYKVNILKYIINKIRKERNCFKWIFTKTRKYSNLIYGIGYELRRITILKLKSFVFYVLYDWKDYKVKIWIDLVLSGCVNEYQK